MALTGKKVYAAARTYTDQAIAGTAGPLAGKNCTIKSVVKRDGRNTVTFKWTSDEGESGESVMVVDDGTPIYVWESGNTYQYGDLAIYASCFYRCITENSDIEFDDTKWNEIGSPDGNYDIVQREELLPARFTPADRKMYYSIEDESFWLWDGYQWIKQEPVTVDSTITAQSENPVQSKAIKAALDGKQDVLAFDQAPTENSTNPVESGGVFDALEDKVDKVTGKGLSANDYSNADKAIVDGVTDALAGKVDAVAGKGLSTNDYTDADAGIVGSVTDALASKVDKVTGKGLSANDYDDTAKGIVDGVSTALNGKVDKVTGKGLSKNDYTDADKAIVDGISTALNTKVDKVQGKQLSTNDYTLEEKLKLAGLENYDDTEITDRVSDVESVIPSTATTSNKLATNNDIPDVSNFITNTVNNLVNYYTKAQTYTQEEVDALISAIVTLDIKAVSVLPTTNISMTTIYLVPSADPQAQNVKDEYINTDGTSAGWELIGSTAIDLTGYVTDAELTAALADYVTSTALSTALAGYVQKSQTAGLLKNDGTVDTNSYATASQLAGKQDTISDLSTIRSGASAGATAYQKPSGGIPKTDLASAVQTSLGKADSAIQSHQPAVKYDTASQGLTDTQKSNARTNIGAGTSNFSGSYSDLTNKPTIPAAQIQSDWNQTTTTAKDYIKNKPTIPSVTGKADKVSGATNGNFAGLDANGNLTDSGKKPGDLLTLGTSSSTAYRGDRGNTAYTHATETRHTTATAQGLYKVGSTAQGHISGLTQVVKSDITALGIPAQDTTYESKSASSGGTAVSLCTTGEKYTWNNKQNALSSMSQSEADTGTSTTGRIITAKVLTDSIHKKAHTMYGVTQLSSSTNLNNYTAPTYSGEYYYPIHGHSITNMPTGASGKPFRLIVESLSNKDADLATGSGDLDYSSSNCTLQTLIVSDIAGTPSVKTYRRHYLTSTWSAWYSYEDEIASLNSRLADSLTNRINDIDGIIDVIFSLVTLHEHVTTNGKKSVPVYSTYKFLKVTVYDSNGKIVVESVGLNSSEASAYIQYYRQKMQLYVQAQRINSNEVYFGMQTKFPVGGWFNVYGLNFRT